MDFEKYDKFTFFYGGPFSQWARCDFVIDGVKYNSAEQWMMANKAVMFADYEILERIMSTSDPREQKALGKQVKDFDVERWQAVAKDIVYQGNMAKFTQNDHMMKSLVETDGTLLVEASPTDAIWGIHMAKDDPRIYDRKNWQGTNWLGEAITKVREDLKERANKK